MPEQEYLNVKDVSVALDVSYITALSYIKNGYLLGIKQGGQWKISKEELRRFMREGNRKEANFDEGSGVT